MQALFDVSTTQQPIVALLEGDVVGVTGVAPPGSCRPTPAQRLRLLPRILALGPRTAGRVLAWTSRWGRHDPEEPHYHLGPLAVDAHRQRQGIGSLIMREHCRRLDASGDVGYLETDRIENVTFYERFGYEVIAEDLVLGVPNWFMRRGDR
jgi:GNAT superfamily N-acetyltransferase